MRIHRTLRCLPILPDLLHHLCLLTPSLGPLGLSIWVCITFGFFFAMLRQSNLAPPSPSAFDPSRHTCMSDIFLAPLGLRVLVRLTKTHQTISNNPVLPIPGVPGHPADPVADCNSLLQSSPTLSPKQPILTYSTPLGLVTVTVFVFARALFILLDALDLDSGMFSLHSLHCGGATATYKQGLDPHHITWQCLWRSDSFWTYVTSTAVSSSPVAL